MSRLRWTTIAVALVAAGFFASTVAAATNYYVNVNTGTDANNGLSSGSPFKTIGFAMSTAVSGDTINVAAGTYVWAAPPC